MRRFYWIAALAFVWTSAAHAAATLVENVDEPTRHPYQEFATANCTLAGDCSIVFPAVTVEDTLVLHASCSFALASGNNLVAFASLGVQGGNPRNALPFFINSTANGFTDYGINANTYLFYATGQHPQIDVFGRTAPVQNPICTISGYTR
jgi:hypothetical protein